VEYQRWDEGYTRARFTPDPGRAAVWRAAAEDLERRSLAGAPGRQLLVDAARGDRR
jgi:hypothetical protein